MWFTSKQQILSVLSCPDPPIFKKIVVRSSPGPAEIGYSPDPVRSSLVRAHLWSLDGFPWKKPAAKLYFQQNFFTEARIHQNSADWKSGVHFALVIL